MKKILIISPSPFDETVGMAGTIFKHADGGDELNWLILTKPEESRWSETELKVKQQEVDKAARFYGFSNVRRLNFLAGTLSDIPKQEFIDVLKGNLEILKPNMIYLPYNTGFGDYKNSFECVVAALETFKARIDKILAYEAITSVSFVNFNPNVYSDISEHIERKMEVLEIFETEVQGYPLAKSADSIKALSKIRGAAISTEYAEAFTLIKEILK